MRTLISATLLLALTACGGGDDEGAKEDDKPSVNLSTVLDACNDEVQTALDEATNNSGPGLEPGTVMRLGDGGKTVDVSPLQAAPFLVQPSVSAAVCILGETKAPNSVRSEVGQVSGLDGRQEAEWDGVSLTYSYDGNTGFTGVFTAAP